MSEEAKKTKPSSDGYDRTYEPLSVSTPLSVPSLDPVKSLKELVDERAAELGLNRSAFVQQVLMDALRKAREDGSFTITPQRRPAQPPPDGPDGERKF